MFQTTITGSPATEMLFPRMSNVVKTYLTALTRMIGCPVDMSTRGLSLIQAGCVSMPEAGLAITGTSCAAPLVRPEAEFFSALLGCDLLLLRCDRTQGMSFDVRLSTRPRWMGGYRLWSAGEKLWLIPDTSRQPSLQIADGLRQDALPPYNNDISRDSGLAQAYHRFADLARRSI